MTARKPKLGPDQVEELVRLREERRWPVRRIARKFGVSQAAVNWRLLRAGVDPWDSTKATKSGQVGGFSPADDAQMLELAKAMSPHKVAEVMGRPRTSVSIRIMTLEIRAEKALEKAA